MSLPTWEVGSDGKRAYLPGRLERWEMSLPTWEVGSDGK